MRITAADALLLGRYKQCSSQVGGAAAQSRAGGKAGRARKEGSRGITVEPSRESATQVAPRPNAGEYGMGTGQQKVWSE